MLPKPSTCLRQLQKETARTARMKACILGKRHVDNVKRGLLVSKQFFSQLLIVRYFFIKHWPWLWTLALQRSSSRLLAPLAYELLVLVRTFCRFCAMREALFKLFCVAEWLSVCASLFWSRCREQSWKDCFKILQRPLRRDRSARGNFALSICASPISGDAADAWINFVELQHRLVE